MPQDPNLYGQRPSKKQKRDTDLSSSLDFTAQLTSLMSNTASSKPASARSRPSREQKDNIFRGSSRPSKQQSKRDEDPKLVLKKVTGTEDEAQEHARAKRNMENKARLYAAMKRGDYVPKEGEAESLVDFDRKWADDVEGKDDHETSSDEDDDDGDEMVEYEDELGRTRQVTKAEKERLERRARRGVLGAEEFERMSARPSAPGNIIYGDAIQSMAFNPENTDEMEALARKRDRSATPPEMKHYDADHEVRSKGTGFYKFSKDEETRKQEMESLEAERKKTEEEKSKGRDEVKEARRRDIEKRRGEMAERRARKQADAFLDELAEG